MVIDMRSRPRSAFPRPTRPRTATPPTAPSDGLEDLEDLEDLELVDDDWTTISCDSCVMADSSTCDDCVVTYLCSRMAIASRGRRTNARLHFDDQESDTLRLFQAAGLAPALRHVARTSLVDHGSAHGPHA